MHTDNQPKKAGNVSDSDHTIIGQYANYFRVGFNAYEIIFDFGQSFSENDQAELCMRIIFNPFLAKSFLSTLQDTFDQFERKYEAVEQSENHPG